MNLQKGQHVFLTLKNGKVYECDVGAVNYELKRLRLENIVIHPDNVKVENFQKFDFDEIISYRKFEENEEKRLSDSPAASPDSIKQDNTNTVKIPEEEYITLLELQKNYRYIKAYDNNFHNAMGILEKCDKIGFCVLDFSKPSRNQRGSVIGISTEGQIFIFDIEVMGDGVFDKGLRAILESEEIVKIVHDCRLLSACLLEKHLTDLKNVFDVEATDLLILYLNQGRIRKHVRSLNYLIQEYLGLPNAVMHPEQHREFWQKRPLEVEYQNKLGIYMSYFIPLQTVMDKCYIKKLKQVSELYNNFWKGGDLILSGVSIDYTPKQKLEQLLLKKGNGSPRGTRTKKRQSQEVKEEEDS